MKKILLLLFCSLFAAALLAAPSDSLRLSSYVSTGGSGGKVLPTNDFTRGEYAGGYLTFGAKFAITNFGKPWQRKAYRNLYYGVGFSQSYFFRRETLGSPFSFYLFQGGTLWDIHPKISLHYELNAGVSFEWVPYDPITNAENIAIGSKTNALVAAILYFNWKFAPRFDLRAGATMQHFSNGASQAPNAGLNMVGGFLELAYHLHRATPVTQPLEELAPPKILPHFEHDVQLVVSGRNVKIDTSQRNIPDVYIKKNFLVMGLNYYLMRKSHYKFRYGVGVEYVYDDSKGTSVHNIFDSFDDTNTLIYKRSPFIKRSTFGIAVRGEVVLPYYSFFADMSLHYTPLEEKVLFYQTIGLKINIVSGLYATIGIKAMQFSKAQYIHWSLGYTFNRKE